MDFSFDRPLDFKQFFERGMNRANFYHYSGEGNGTQSSPQDSPFQGIAGKAVRARMDVSKTGPQSSEIVP